MSILPIAVLAVVVLLLIGGTIALLVWLFTASSRQESRRIAEFTTYATVRGFTYTAVDRDLPQRFTGIPFGRGTARVARHVVQGHHDGRAVIAFEYTFTTRAGERTRRHRYAVVAVALPTPVPGLEVAPAGAVGRFVDAVTGTDRRLGDPAFDAAYQVSTDSRPFAADVLTPELRAWLVTQRPPVLRLRDADLVVFGEGRLEPAEVDRRLAFAAAWLDRVPDRVWERAAGGPPAPPRDRPADH